MLSQIWTKATSLWSALIPEPCHYEVENGCVFMISGSSRRHVLSFSDVRGWRKDGKAIYVYEEEQTHIIGDDNDKLGEILRRELPDQWIVEDEDPDMQVLKTCLQFLSLDDDAQRRYLMPVPADVLQVHAGESETLTRKPLLIMTLITSAELHRCEWLEDLAMEQRQCLLDLEAVLALAHEIGIWSLFSLDPSQRKLANEYIHVWSALRTLSSKALQSLGWPATNPALPFKVLLDRFTSTVTGYVDERMVR